MREITSGKRSVLIAFVTYTLIALVTVLSAWIINLHRFDLSITISRYVAVFILAYFVFDWQWFSDTIFIWENIFIYLLLGKLWLEKN